MKSLLMNKKGFTYILMASFILVCILVVFLTENQYKYQDQESLYQIRIRAMNDFVRNFNSDVHRASYIAAFRSLVALEDSVTSSGVFLKDMNDSFRETFFYGTINGTQMPLMENSSFNDYLQKVQLLSSDVGIILSANVTGIELKQFDPWNLEVHVFMVVNMTDSENLVTWYYNKEYVTIVPIYDLRDPMYGVYTYNRLPNTIRAFNETDLVVNNDTTNLINFINNSYYKASTFAPSFIMRFEGSTDPDMNGIESVVNIHSLSSQNLQVDPNKVKIDYIYFNNLTTDKTCDFQNVPADLYFVVPSDRIGPYNLSGLNYSMACP